MRISLLGTVEVSGPGRSELSAHLNTIVARLALTPGVPVGMDEIFEWTWSPSNMPKNPAGALQVNVSRIRQAFGATPINLHTLRNAYRLDIPKGSVDLDLFRSLMRQAMESSNPGRIASLEQALDLWNGKPLSGISPTDPVLIEQTHLQELHYTAQELYNDSLIDAGSVAGLIPTLKRLTAQHPYRERFSLQLMKSLAAAGRKADALAHYRKVRASLNEDLGIEPMSELQNLHSELLQEEHLG